MKKMQLSRFRIILFPALLMLVITSVFGVATQEVRNPDMIIDVLASGPDTLEPAHCFSLEGELAIRQMYENLIAWKGESMTEFEPRVAAKVPSKENGLISEDNLTYTFPIRKGIKFHNGDELTPEDVEYTFERNIVLDPVGGPMGMVMNALLGVWSTRDDEGNIQVTFEEIDKSVEVDGDNVVFHLKQPSPGWLQIISQTWGAILNKDWMIQHGSWPGTKETWKEYNNPQREEMILFDKAMGAGPYKLVRWEKDQEVVFEFFEDYFRGLAKIRKAVIKIVPEWSTRFLMLKTGDADFVTVPKQFVEQVKEAEGVRVREGLAAQKIFAVIFNQHVKTGSHKYVGSGKLDGNGVPYDFFSNLKIRKAFNYAFDFQTYIEDIFKGDARQPVGALPWTMPFVNPNQETYHFDSEKAEELFKEVYDGELWEKGFKLTMPYPTEHIETKGMVDVLKFNLKEINPKFDVDTIPLTWSEFYADLAQKFTALAPVLWINDYPDPANSCQAWMGSRGYYGQHMSLGGKYDKYCHMGATTIDYDIRKEAYDKVQELSYEDAVAIWGAQPELWHVSRTWVKGWSRYPPMFAIFANYYYQLEKKADDS